MRSMDPVLYFQEADPCALTEQHITEIYIHVLALNEIAEEISQ